MSDVKRNPVSQPQDEEYDYRQYDAADYTTEIAGPGGRHTNIENNERGILDAIVARAIGHHKVAELGSDHDSFGVGIYAEGQERFSD